MPTTKSYVNENMNVHFLYLQLRFKMYHKKKEGHSINVKIKHTMKYNSCKVDSQSCFNFQVPVLEKLPHDHKIIHMNHETFNQEIYSDRNVTKETKNKAKDKLMNCTLIGEPVNVQNTDVEVLSEELGFQRVS